MMNTVILIFESNGSTCRGLIGRHVLRLDHTANHKWDMIKLKVRVEILDCLTASTAAQYVPSYATNWLYLTLQPSVTHKPHLLSISHRPLEATLVDLVKDYRSMFSHHPLLRQQVETVSQHRAQK